MKTNSRLTLAASYGQADAVRLLLAAGAKPDAVHPEKNDHRL